MALSFSVLEHTIKEEYIFYNFIYTCLSKIYSEGYNEIDKFKGKYHTLHLIKHAYVVLTHIWLHITLSYSNIEQEYSLFLSYIVLITHELPLATLILIQTECEDDFLIIIDHLTINNPILD